MLNSKYKIIIAAGVLVLITLLIINWTLKKPSPPNKPKEEIKIAETAFTSAYSAPTIAVAGNVGVNLQAKDVQTSIKNIEKLNLQLPYNAKVKLDSGEETNVYIPKTNPAISQWLITVTISEVDYEIPDNSPEMAKQRDLFRKAAKSIHDWIQKQGVDPKNVMILWGDTKKVQDRSLEWLQQQ